MSVSASDFSLTSDAFDALAAEGYNRIPLILDVLADMDTPLSAYLKLAEGPYSYLFESVQGGEKWGRYSIIGLPCSTVLKVFGHNVRIEINGETVNSKDVDDPFAFVEQFKSEYRVPNLPGVPSFFGGLVGYFAYDTVRYVESRLAKSFADDPLGVPDILLMVSEDVLVFDNLAGKIHLITHADPAQEQAFDQAIQRLLALASRLPKTAVDIAPLHLADEVPSVDYTSSFSQSEFESVVERIKNYVLAGDVMQVVPSQRLAVDFNAQPINLYRALRSFNPSPYMFYLDLDDFHIVGSSPEILARFEDGEVVVRPIAGTRPRGQNEDEDKRLECELLADPKEIAEHLMLIDLGRNDVGRVAKTGSVTLTEKMVIERYSHVMHIVSNVTGEVTEGLTAIDVLKAALPAGTLSGAPKIRAMEIIDELEPVKRGVYGGAVGYLAWNGNMDTAIAIRTAVVKDRTLHIQAGAGIVADSVPHKEWEETLNKAGALLRAAALVKHSMEIETKGSSS